MEIVIIGIGQSLRGDDGAGLAAVQHWQRAYPNSANHPSLRIEMVELPGLSLLDLIFGTSAAILVDAVRSGAKPGTLHLLSESDLDAFETDSGSAHGVGVAESLALGNRLYHERMPADIILIGVEASGFGVGEILSPEVQRAIPIAARTIEEQLQNRLNREIRE